MPAAYPTVAMERYADWLAHEDCFVEIRKIDAILSIMAYVRHELYDNLNVDVNRVPGAHSREWMEVH